MPLKKTTSKKAARKGAKQKARRKAVTTKKRAKAATKVARRTKRPDTVTTAVGDSDPLPPNFTDDPLYDPTLETPVAPPVRDLPFTQGTPMGAATPGFPPIVDVPDLEVEDDGGEADDEGDEMLAEIFNEEARIGT